MLERKIYVVRINDQSFFNVVEYSTDEPPSVWQVLETFTDRKSAENWLAEIEERDEQ